MGAVSGWILELFFRRFFSKANPERKWVNPGFCTGPYLPIYGFGLCIMFLAASMEQYHLFSGGFWNRAIYFAAAAVLMTVIEYAAGVFCLKIGKMRLWDYSDEWKNIDGFICPKFSLIWAALGAVYYFLIHSHILKALDWLSQNLAFSFFIGLFFGVFIIDVVNSAQLVAKLKKFADDNDVIIRYENIKAHIRSVQDRTAQKPSFFHPFRSERPLNEHLKEMLEDREMRRHGKREDKGGPFPHA